MSKQYLPQTPFNVPFKVLTSSMQKVNGVNTLTFVEGDTIYFCSAKAWIGTNKNINDISSEEDTLTIESWYIGDLKRHDRIKLLDDNSVWDVPLTPENINRRNQYMKFKVVRIRG